MQKRFVKCSINKQYWIPSILLGTFMVRDQAVMESIVEAAIKNGCFGFDTAPSYGTEAILGKAIESLVLRGVTERKDIWIQDKIDGLQMQRGHIDDDIRNSLELLKIKYFDLVLVHWPFERYLDYTIEQLILLKERGKVLHIGICNIDYKKYLRIKNRQIIEFVQNEISPINQEEKNVFPFREKGINIQAYSPLARMGKGISDSVILSRIAYKYGVSIPQIILKWHITRNVSPIFTSHKKLRIAENLDLSGFELCKEDMEDISEMNRDYRIFPQSFGCPGY